MARNRADVGLIYVIESDQQRAVKIGFTTDLPQRLANLKTGNASGLRIRWAIKGTRRAEEAIHHWLKRFKKAREWYPDDWLIDSMIDELEYHVDISEEACLDFSDIRAVLPQVPSSQAGLKAT